MTKADELNALADRCEREEASRGLDEAIALVCGWETVLDAFNMPRWRMIGQSRWWAFEPPRFGTSLDAAVTLVPEGVQEACIRKFPSGIYVRITTASGRVGYGESKTSEAAARCAAALRARAALSQTDGEEEGTGSPSAPHPARTA